jgi:hypothetical protein
MKQWGEGWSQVPPLKEWSAIVRKHHSKIYSDRKIIANCFIRLGENEFNRVYGKLYSLTKIKALIRANGRNRE